MTLFVNDAYTPLEVNSSPETSMDCPAYHHLSQSPPVTKHTNLPHHISTNLVVDIQQLRNSETAEMEDIEILDRWDPSPVLMIVSHEDEKDPHSPQQVTRKVKMVIHKWGHVQPINPERFFLKMLLSRGYSTKMIPASTSQNKCPPSIKQMRDYDNELVHAIKNNDLHKVQALHQQGRSMSACNKFSESVVHMACRRASFEVADYVLSNGGDCNIVDDYGRTPLHDACWRMEPSFDVVTLLLDKNIDLLRTLDVRGSTPLKYVREEHWLQWCAYIFHQKEKYWLPIGDPTENNKRLRSF